MKRIYRMTEAGIRAVQRRVIGLTAALFGAVSLVILGIEAFRLDWSKTSNWISVPFALLVLIVVVVVILYRGYKQMRVIYEAIIIEVDEATVTKRQLRIPEHR